MPKSAPIDVDTILESAAKPEAKKADPFLCTDKPALTLANHWVAAALAMEAQQAKLKTSRDKIIDLITPWHLDACRQRGAHEPSVLIIPSKGGLRVSFKNAYEKIRHASEEQIADLAGDNFAEWFATRRTISVKKEITSDPAKLTELVQALVTALGADKFAETFDVDATIAPTEQFTSERHKQTNDLLTAFEAAGVHQQVSLARV